MRGKVGSDYAIRANVQKIDAECLKWFLKEQKISIRSLVRNEEVSVSEKTIQRWMKRGEMPSYLIEEICDALALESVCDMRENSELKCAEPVTTFRYRDTDEETVALHARIGIVIRIPKETLRQILKVAENKNGTGFGEVGFEDDTAAVFIEKGKAAWDDHYIPPEWLVSDALDAGLLKRDEKGNFVYTSDHGEERENE